MFLLQLILFLFLVIFIFSIPGYFLLGLKLKNGEPWKNFALSTVIGFVVFSLLSYLLLVTHFHILILPIILIIDFLYLKKETLPNFPQRYESINLVFPIIFLVGIIGQLLVIAPSGINLNGNIVFWSAHGHDGVWHLALIQQLQNGYPFQNPDLTNQKLVNYHFFSDLPIAGFNYFFRLPTIDLYFRFFPLFFSILLGILSYQLGKILGKSNSAGLWAFIYTFFAGSFGFIVTFIKNRTIEGESLFWSSQVQSSIGNPPQIAAFILVLTVILLLWEFLQNPTKRIGLLLILILGTLAEFKIYGAVILIASLFFVSLWRAAKAKKIDLLIIFVLSSILSACLYLPNTSGSLSLLLFEPWWFIRTMVVASDKLDWLDLELKRQTYLAHSSYIRVAQIEIEAFLIFLLGNLGMRFLGFWQLGKSFKYFFKDYLSQLIFFILIISLILPMLFIQKGIPANTIQFFQYFLLIFGILAGVSTAQLLNNIPVKWAQVLVGLIIVILAVPTQIGLLKVFYSRAPFALINSQELVALDWLQKNSKPNDIVLTPPFQKGQQFNGPTPPIWNWSDTSYIPAFSQRQVFVSDIEQLDIMGYNYRPRQEIQKQIFSTSDSVEFENLLKQSQIQYIYFPKAQKPLIDLIKTNLQNILNNNEVEIWKFNLP